MRNTLGLKKKKKQQPKALYLLCYMSGYFTCVLIVYINSV